MQTRDNANGTSPDVRSLIQNALLDFKELSRQIRSECYNGQKLSILSLYTLLCLRRSKPMLRYDIMKRLHVNYYDAGNALEPLILSGLVSSERCLQRSNLKLRVIELKRYSLTLDGEIFVDEVLNKVRAG